MNKLLKSLIYFLFTIGTGMISYTINHSIFWAILATIFTPVAWIKWLIYHDISMSILRETFSFLFN